MTWIPFGLIFAGFAGLALAGPVSAPATPGTRGAGSIESSRQSLLSDMETLGDLIADAKKERDMPRLNCLMEVKVDADKTTELATAEYLRARHPRSDAFERVLANSVVLSAPTRSTATSTRRW